MHLEAVFLALTSCIYLSPASYISPIYLLAILGRLQFRLVFFSLSDLNPTGVESSIEICRPYLPERHQVRVKLLSIS